MFQEKMKLSISKQYIDKYLRRVIIDCLYNRFIDFVSLSDDGEDLCFYHVVLDDFIPTFADMDSAISEWKNENKTWYSNKDRRYLIIVSNIDGKAVPSIREM